jgi:hypothetical protein
LLSGKFINRLKGNAFMRTIIAGSRTVTRHEYLLSAVRAITWTPTEIISGAARGADALGERWALANRIPLRRMPADWNRHCRRAGFLRNVEMAQCADALLALWDGKSAGTAHMIDIATRSGLVVSVWRVPCARETGL